jgi:hypothetical protein
MVQCDFHWQCRVFQKWLYNGIANATVWRVLRKRLHLKAYKSFIIEHLDQHIDHIMQGVSKSALQFDERPGLSLPRHTDWLTVSRKVTSNCKSESLHGWQSVSQYALVSSPLCGRLTRYCFFFKCFDLEFVVLSLWGALSDEMPGLSFVTR